MTYPKRTLSELIGELANSDRCYRAADELSEWTNPTAVTSALIELLERFRRFGRLRNRLTGC
jgi:hypothetical protein